MCGARLLSLDWFQKGSSSLGGQATCRCEGGREQNVGESGNNVWGVTAVPGLEEGRLIAWRPEKYRGGDVHVGRCGEV